MAYSPTNYIYNTPEGISPYHNLLSNAMANYQNAINTKYQPRTLEADIFNKQFAPLAQIAASPLAMAMLPEQKQQINNLLSALLSRSGMVSGAAQGGGTGAPNPTIANMFNEPNPQQNQNGGSNMPSSIGGNIPSPSSQMPSPQNLNIGRGKNGESQTPVQTPFVQPTSTDGNIPYSSNIPQAGQGLGQSAVAKEVAPYREQIAAKGTPYYDLKTNSYRTTDSDVVLTNDQLGMGSIQTTIPLLNKLKKEAKDVLVPGRGLKWLTSAMASGGESLLNIPPETLKSMGISRDYYDKVVQFKKDLDNVGERIKSSYSFGNNEQGMEQAMSITSPGSFANYKSYSSQLDQEIDNLLRQNETYKKHLVSGFESTPGKQPEIANIPKTPKLRGKIEFDETNQTNENKYAPPKTVQEAIKKESEKFGNTMMQFEGPDPQQGNKIARFNVPQKNSQAFIDAKYKRVG